MERLGYIVTGQVQGVGFRPFVYRCATACGLTGCVGNTPEGVRIEVQGEPENLGEFERRFETELPPLARIIALTRMILPPLDGEASFIIVASENRGHAGHGVLVSPDVAVCERCLADMLDPVNRRYGYAFTNCTDCGPRYTITRSIPYDRPFTSMACFSLCNDCRREYEDPMDRRFHAQPNACAECGPEMWLEWAEGQTVHSQPRGGAALLELLKALQRGKVAAVKGLGGFHLACDARNPEAVAALRRRKNRPHKALAVMVADLKAARDLVRISPEAEAALTSPRRPIVICPARLDSDGLPRGVAHSVIPDTASLGVMLPCAPLHHLLFHPEAVGGSAAEAPEALVMTSGNAGGEPICLGNREARKRLSGIADVFLFHNRDILVRVDDSVMFGGEDLPSSLPEPAAPSLMLRRARGFVPEPLILEGGDGLACVFAAGAQLKHAFCLTRGRAAFVSQHIGDLDNVAALDFFEETLRHLMGLLEVEPVAVVRDLHPDYPSSRVAESFAAARGLPVFELQHHYAHIFAVLAEYGLRNPVLGLVLDGSGLGEDGTVWGGELLLVEPEVGRDSGADQKKRRMPGRRLGHFSSFVLPGGEAAIREPWRIAEALRQAAGFAPDLEKDAARPWMSEAGAAMPMIAEMLRRGVNCPVTTSCGRLFDAVAAECGLCFVTTYEGQAAVRLEEAQDFMASGAYSAPVREEDGALVLDVAALFRAGVEERAAGCAVGTVSRRFHRGLIAGLADWARAAADITGVATVALGGGVLNNRTVLGELPLALRMRGLEPLLPHVYPAGDGAIALGQAAWCRLLV